MLSNPIATIKFVIEFIRFTYEFLSTVHDSLEFIERFQLIEHFNNILMLVERYFI